MELFLDPVLRGPILASILMGFLSGLVGALVFLRKRSLVGEALSHCAYPGVVVSLFFFALSPVYTFLGAVLFAMLGLLCIDLLERRFRVSSDAALCFVLSFFFGIGVLMASQLQVTSAILFRSAQVFLFGQVATMDDSHIFLYAGLTLFVGIFFLALFPRLKILYFDPIFSRAIGLPKGGVELLTRALLVLAIVFGMRSVGVVLLSALLIAPPAAARQWTGRFGPFLALSGGCGALAGYAGSALSLFIPKWMGFPHLALATGPMIVLVATMVALFSLLFAPQRGRVTRAIRAFRFRRVCARENLLKALYRGDAPTSSSGVLASLRSRGLVTAEAGQFSLTSKGRDEAERTIRLHRLWEAYLIHMGQKREVGHHSAEQMEHILTPDLEKALSALITRVEKGAP